MIIQVIHCGLPKGKAITTSTGDDEVYTIAVNRDLTEEELRKELRHEISHIINDDFHVEDHVTLLERMIRHRILSDDDMEHIDFYHHYIDKKDDDAFFGR